MLLLTRLLAEAGYTNVSSTRQPTEVCALHRRHSYDLILLDLQMPAMDGFASWRRSRPTMPTATCRSSC